MAGMLCKCGCVMSTTQAPNDIQLRVYTDREWDKIMDCETIIPWELPRPEHDVWKCPECQRVYVFEDTKTIMRYVLEK